MRPHASVVLLTVGLFSGLARPTEAQQPVGPPTIVTAGEATLKKAPDQAWLLVATDARAPKSADARQLGAQAMTDVQAALKATGLAPDALRTLAYTLEPETTWTNGHATTTGYVAHNQIEVRVDDLNTLPAVLDAANTPKNVTLSISGPRFDVKDRETLERQLLSAAVQNALARARAMAEGAQLTLGAIQTIENDTPTTPGAPVPMRMMAVGSGAAPGQPTPVTPGEIELRAAVRLTVIVR
jgi:uncharacterized protein YggE